MPTDAARAVVPDPLDDEVLGDPPEPSKPNSFDAVEALLLRGADLVAGRDVDALVVVVTAVRGAAITAVTGAGAREAADARLARCLA